MMFDRCEYQIYEFFQVKLLPPGKEIILFGIVTDEQIGEDTARRKGAESSSGAQKSSVGQPDSATSLSLQHTIHHHLRMQSDSRHQSDGTSRYQG